MRKLFGVFVVVVLVAAACGGGDSDESDDAQETGDAEEDEELATGLPNGEPTNGSTGEPPGGLPALDEEVWVIVKPDPEAAPAGDEAAPGSGAMICRLPEAGRVKDVPLPLEHTDVSTSISAYIASVDVTPIVDETTAVDVKDADLEIETFRAGGAGGQHVNKTESAVRIRHLPSGVVVSCQNERSQHRNRKVAMQMLKARLVRLEESRRQVNELNRRAHMPSGEP